MKFLLAIRRLLAAVMVTGLVLAPLARPAMAAAPSAMPMQAMPTQGPMAHEGADHAMAGHLAAVPSVGAMSAAVVDEMAEMPCCPSEAPPTAVDCGKCLSMAGCSSNFLTGMPGTVALPLPAATIGAQMPTNDFRPDGLGHPPPEYPPRSLV
ncbi:conserved hypothetical protein [Rhodopseudomonas palustris HaA2]|uniref:Uncharacterized protein n=1 Tax=Rhodopseudomonas palustris (strain HaA2) TaxID=316058 RepID=Q2J150_RHOP2|nr:hypothetical protein [Rhodopseudomonas palustris]ABD05810.1 conserved hypothetical protein [Rhodopseudomonas palustris HaA2]